LTSLHLRFFWQLIIAFVAVILLAGGGTLLAGHLTFRPMEILTLNSVPSLMRPWSESLSRYHAEHGGWDGVDELIAGYPCGDGWIAGGLGEDIEYVVAATNGTIVAASREERVGQSLRYGEKNVALPIQVGDQIVGYLAFSPFGTLRDGLHVVLGYALRRFLIVGGIVGVMALVTGLALSRLISRPVVRLTEATRAVAAGDLDVRVRAQYPGELGELAAAFNQMTVELGRADRLRRNLTADVAHELRTPLSVIQGKLEGVLDGVYPATPAHLEPILEEARLLNQLVEDLRLLALAEAGQLTLERRPVDVGDLLRDAQVNFGPQADDRGVTLALDLPAGLPPVLGDRRRISQVLGNLVTNALRHTSQGGRVTLSAALDGGSVAVSVADTGTGIPLQDQPYVFERFWRGEKSRSRAGGGSGLGLAIARQLVEMHDGVIGVVSAPGEGAVFTFTLPLA